MRTSTVILGSSEKVVNRLAGYLRVCAVRLKRFPKTGGLLATRHNIFGARDAKTHLAFGHQFITTEDRPAQLSEL